MHAWRLRRAPSASGTRRACVRAGGCGWRGAGVLQALWPRGRRRSGHGGRASGTAGGRRRGIPLEGAAPSETAPGAPLVGRLCEGVPLTLEPSRRCRRGRRRMRRGPHEEAGPGAPARQAPGVLRGGAYCYGVPPLTGAQAGNLDLVPVATSPPGVPVALVHPAVRRSRARCASGAPRCDGRTEWPSGSLGGAAASGTRNRAQRSRGRPRIESRRGSPNSPRRSLRGAPPAAALARQHRPVLRRGALVRPALDVSPSGTPGERWRQSPPARERAGAVGCAPGV